MRGPTWPLGAHKWALGVARGVPIWECNLGFPLNGHLGVHRGVPIWECNLGLPLNGHLNCPCFKGEIAAGFVLYVHVNCATDVYKWEKLRPFKNPANLYAHKYKPNWKSLRLFVAALDGTFLGVITHVDLWPAANCIFKCCFI